MIKRIMNKIANKKKQRGYALLEYCAGAAIIAGVLWGGLSLVGERVNSLLSTIADWAAAREQSIQDND